MLTSNRNRTTTMAGSAGAGSEDGSTEIQGSSRWRSPCLRVLHPCKRRTRRYDWCSASSCRSGRQRPATQAASCTYGRSSSRPLPEGHGKTYVQKLYMYVERWWGTGNIDSAITSHRKKKKDFERLTKSCCTHDHGLTAALLEPSCPAHMQDRTRPRWGGVDCSA